MREASKFLDLSTRRCSPRPFAALSIIGASVRLTDAAWSAIVTLLHHDMHLMAACARACRACLCRLYHISDWLLALTSAAGITIGSGSGLVLDGHDIWKTLLDPSLPSPRTVRDNCD